MKKNLRLFMLALLCAVAGTVWGADEHTYVIDLTTGTNAASLDGVKVVTEFGSLTYHKGTGSNPPAYYTNGTAVRFYAGNYFVLEAGDNTITKVELTNTESQVFGEGAFAPAGTYSISGKVETWVGSTSTLTVTSSNKPRLTQIKVTYEGSSQSVIVDVPTFDPVSGTAVKAGDDVTITPASGCSLAYSVDGGNSYIQSAGAATYTITAPITIKAKSIDGDGNESSEVSAAYTISVGAPTFNPEPGSVVQSGSSVTISPANGCKLSYTVNGGSATVGELNQNVTVEITENTTIKARCIDAYGNKSSEVSAVYSLPSSGGDDGIITFEDELTTYSDWEFTNIERKQQASSPSAHGGTYYGTTTSGGNGKESASITTKDKISTPVSMKFYYTKTSSNTNSSSKFLIQVSSNGTDWIDVATGNTMNQVTQGTWYELSADLSSYSNVYVRACYSGTSAIRAIDDVELITGTQKAEPELAFNPTSVELNIGDAFTAPTLSYANGFDGTVTYSSSNTDVATVNTTTGEVTILDVVGSTTITASSQATDNFLAGEASYTIIVVDPNAVEYTATYLFKQSPMTTDYNSGVTVTSESNYYVTEPSTWISGDVTLVVDGKYRWHTNASGNDPIDLRLYTTGENPSTMTFSAPQGSLISKIVFTGTDGMANLSANVGAYANKTWEGNMESVVFTAGAKTFVETVTITYTTPATTETISNATSSEWITYCSTNDLSFENLDVTPYIVVGVRKKADDSFVSLIQKISGNVVPANTGILINMGTETEVNATVTTASGIDLSGNMLVGVTEATPIPQIDEDEDKTNFVLANGSSGLGFYKVQSQGGTIKANRAYLQIPTVKLSTGTEANVIFIEDDATAINEVEEMNSTDGAWYTLSGVRMAQPAQKGVYIHNGRKVVVK